MPPEMSALERTKTPVPFVPPMVTAVTIAPEAMVMPLVKSAVAPWTSMPTASASISAVTPVLWIVMLSARSITATPGLTELISPEPLMVKVSDVPRPKTKVLVSVALTI